MRIKSVETALYQIPRQPGLASASARIDSTGLLLANIRTDDGLEGWERRDCGGVEMNRLGRS